MIVLSSIISMIATVVIAALTYQNFKLNETMQKRDEQNKRETSDMLQAIVVSNIISVPVSKDGIEERKKWFIEAYKGGTKIF